MLNRLKTWFDDMLDRSIERQEQKLREDLVEIKSLSGTPKRAKLIADVERYLTETERENAEGRLREATILRNEIALDAAQVQREELARRRKRLEELSKKS